MAEIININDYRAMKQRQFFIDLYLFLNKNLDDQLENLFLNFEKDVIQICKRNYISPLYVSFFKVPTMAFMVTVFINNSDLKGFFPDPLKIDNELNRVIFRNTLVKIIETYDDHYHFNDYKSNFEDELEVSINISFRKILEIIPDKIILV